MPRVQIRFFRDSDGTVPLVEWLARLPDKAEMKCLVKLQRLAELGHEIRRPEADFLHDGIYELRATLQGVHYRMLYFFVDRWAVVVSHGIVKQDRVPRREIDLAILRRVLVEQNPMQHTAEQL
ncbi:MAG TPA: type II toxin-antitoxin system RelE/ParE family toxin [Planctomycetota bacterium]|jgi:phage-related protein|nr:type II toxin-antitoxin system RelE/ParE family toxin [Planctomycetota bacterium]